MSTNGDGGCSAINALVRFADHQIVMCGADDAFIVLSYPDAVMAKEHGNSESASTTQEVVPVAQYVRMSTEHQRYSTEN